MMGVDQIVRFTRTQNISECIDYEVHPSVLFCLILPISLLGDMSLECKVMWFILSTEDTDLSG